MAKNKIFTVGFDLPGDEFEYVPFDSDTTLLDADIILFEPSLGNASGHSTYNGKTLLSEGSSFSAQQQVEHWKSEIVSAVKAGKLVVVWLVKPRECYRYTGRNEYSGTGRSRVTTNIVTEISSYQSVPNISKVTAKSGTEIRLQKDSQLFAPYWSEFFSMSRYEVEIEGDFKHILLKSKSGDRTLGAMIRSTGTLLLIPPIRYDEKEFLRTDKKDGQSYWTVEASRFGKRLVATLGSLAESLKKEAIQTPPPEWVADSVFRLEAERTLELEIGGVISKLSSLQNKKTKLEQELTAAGSLRNLLFEQGKPLEAAIVDALRELGFSAQPFADGESEFDVVFHSAEGRFLGEAEGKDSKAINIDKMSQLERNIQEDFARDDVAEYAKGVLFGNAFRLIPIDQRGDFFTDKCISAAKRVGAALVRTPDLFIVVKYLKEHPEESDFAKACRQAIFDSSGEVVKFPAVPTTHLATEVAASTPVAEVNGTLTED